MVELAGARAEPGDPAAITAIGVAVVVDLSVLAEADGARRALGAGGPAVELLVEEFSLLRDPIAVVVLVVVEVAAVERVIVHPTEFGIDVVVTLGGSERDERSVLEHLEFLPKKCGFCLEMANIRYICHPKR